MYWFIKDLNDKHKTSKKLKVNTVIMLRWEKIFLYKILKTIPKRMPQHYRKVGVGEEHRKRGCPWEEISVRCPITLYQMPPLILSQMGVCLRGGSYGGCLYNVTCFL